MPDFSFRNPDNTEQNEKQTIPTGSSAVTEERIKKSHSSNEKLFFFPLLLTKDNTERLIKQKGEPIPTRSQSILRNE